ncbi:MAG: PAS domain-containing protein [Coleofasciculaceae cyanobacterium]
MNQTQTDLTQESILIVDDNFDNLQLLTHMISERGHKVYIAPDGALALQSVLSHLPDLIVLDIMMPGIDGYEVCSRLKGNPITQDIPIIFISALNEVFDKVKAFELGASDFITKPFQEQEVLARIEHQLQIRRLTQQLRQQNRQLACNAKRLSLRSDIAFALSQGGEPDSLGQGEGGKGKLDLSTMLSRCCQAFVQHLDVAFARIWTFNSEVQMLELQASAGMYTHIKGAHARIPLGSYKIGRIAAQHQPHLTNNVNNDPQISNLEWARREGMVAFAGYPLIVEERLIGVLAMFARHPLEETTLELLASVATEIAIGIERKQLEIALQESQRWLRTINEANPNIIYVYDLVEQRLIYSNREVYQILGYSPEEIIQLGNNFVASLIHPEDREKCYQKQQRLKVAQDNQVLECEYRIQHKNQQWLWLWGREVVFTRDAEGKPRQILGTATDISDRKHQEEALQLIVEGTATSTGEDFFRTCSRYLAQVLQVRYAFLSVRVNGSISQVRTLAFWTGEDFSENFEYEQAGTPCEEVFAGSLTYYPEGIQKYFPNDKCLSDLGVESYLGIPLIDRAGTIQGILGIMHTSPLKNNLDQESIIKIFAARAAAELQRQQAETEIQFLLSTTASIAQSDNFNIALSSMLDSCCQFIGWDLAEAWLPNAEGTQLENFFMGCINEPNCCSFRKIEPSLKEFIEQSVRVTFAPGEGLPGRVRLSQQPEWIEDVSFNSSSLFVRHEIAAAAGLKAGFGVPIIADQSVLAVMVFFKREALAPDSHLLQLIEAVASQVALLMQRKLSREKLRISEDKLAEAQRIAHLGHWDFYVPTGKIICSEEKFRIFGLEPNQSQLTFERILTLIHADDRALFQKTIEQALRSGKSYQFDFRIVRPTGEIRHIEQRGKAITNSQGEVIKLFGTVMDITERKQEAQNIKATLRKLQSTQSRLIQSEKMSSLGQMVAGIAHEINNPISFIQGNIGPASEYAKDLLELVKLYQVKYPQSEEKISQKLEDFDLDFVADDLPKLLISMQKGAERVSQIVLSLQKFSRLNEAAYKRVDIHECIENTLVILQHRFRQTTRRSEIQIAKQYSSLPYLDCYPGELTQVFMNILSNAIEALNAVDEFSNNEKPKIWIRTERQEDDTGASPGWLSIYIANNGPTIEPQFVAKIFDPFFTTKPVGSGQGLGLSISYQIVVDKHRGRLTCQSTLERRTEFVVELPLSGVAE